LSGWSTIVFLSMGHFYVTKAWGILGSENVRSIIFQKSLGGEASQERLYIYIYIYIYIYCIYIQKDMQKDKLVAYYMKPCIFVLLVDEHYITMKLEMSSIVY
jgi:hypothetical protein